MATSPAQLPADLSDFRHVARRLAEEVKDPERASRRTWRKVTKLMEQFGVQRLTPDVREQMAAAFAAVDLVADPPLEDVELFETVRLSVQGAQFGSLAAGEDALRVSRWPTRGGADIVWVDVAIAQVTEPRLLLEQLETHCGAALTIEAVNDLLSADSLPSVADHPNGVRKVSTFAVRTWPGDGDPADRDASKAGIIALQQVEFLQGDGWIVSCWHMLRATTDGVEEEPEQLPTDHAEISQAVRRRWDRGARCSSGDLGLAIMAELAQTYTRARRTFLAWYELWELDFGGRKAATETTTPTQLASFVALLRQHLEALHLPNYSRETSAQWFTGCTDCRDGVEVNEHLERALGNLASFSEVLRGSTQMVATMRFNEHTQRTERFQETATVIAAILLVPTLVAGIFGANTALPGGGDWAGFELMVAVMVTGAVLTFFGLTYWRQRSPKEEADGAR